MTTETYGRADIHSTAGGLAGLVARHEDMLLLVGRVLLGAIFAISGYGKVMAIGAFAASMSSRGIPEALAYLGAVAEFAGGVALIFGLATRYAAIVTIIFVVVATLIAHRYWEFADAAARRAQLINFEKNLTIIGGLITLMVTGAGRFSVDGLLRRR